MIDPSMTQSLPALSPAKVHGSAKCAAAPGASTEPLPLG
jgi:hypothetical protein